MYYTELQKIITKVQKLQNVSSILSWDNATMMPKKSSESRSEEMALISSIAHAEFTGEKTADLIAEIEQNELGKLDEWQKRDFKLIKRAYIHSSSISSKLVEEFSKATSKCEMVWREARPENDFNKLLPYLTEVVNLKKEIASIKAEILNKSKYDALLDEYEPEQNMKVIDEIFGKVKSFLPDFIEKAINKQKSVTRLPITGNFSVEKQKALGVKVMQRMGFDFDRGRLDISTHPFCGGTPFDIRITTRYREDEFISSLMGVIHETGHALYNMNLPEKYQNQFVGLYLGMSFHESQSLIMEMHAGSSREFWGYMAPNIEEAFGVSGAEYSADNLYNIVNHVKKSFIRVDSDEVTYYPMHVILRYELEKEIIENNLDLRDLPDAWNSKMKEYLSITPPDFKDGCMQDVHWMWGAFGYFPSYLYGAMIAANLMDESKKQYSVIPEELGKGEFTSLNKFLNENVRNYGSRYRSDELIKKATGHELSVDVYKAYLENKYL